MLRTIEEWTRLTEAQHSLHDLFRHAENRFGVYRTSTGAEPHSIKVIKHALLIDKLDINELDSNGNTLLHKSVMLTVTRGCMPAKASSTFLLWQHLLSLGVDLSIQNKLQMTAIDLFFLLIENVDNRSALYFSEFFNVVKIFPRYTFFIVPVLEIIILKDINDVKNYCDYLEIRDLTLGVCEDLLHLVTAYFPNDDMPNLKNNLKDKIIFYKCYPNLEQAIAKIVCTSESIKCGIYRYMYFNHTDFPLYALMNAVPESKCAEFIDPTLLMEMRAMLIKFAGYAGTLRFLKVTQLEPLTSAEIKYGRDCFVFLDASLNKYIHKDALEDYQKHQPNHRFFDMDQQYKAHLADDKLLREPVLMEIKKRAPK